MNNYGSNRLVPYMKDITLLVGQILEQLSEEGEVCVFFLEFFLVGPEEVVGGFVWRYLCIALLPLYICYMLCLFGAGRISYIPRNRGSIPRVSLVCPFLLTSTGFFVHRLFCA